MEVQPKIFRAALVFPADRPVIENGYVSVINGLITKVGRWNGKQQSDSVASSIVDLGDVALIPALVNAHTHLEFSHLRKPLGFPGIEFTQWIREIIALRRSRNDLADGTNAGDHSTSHFKRTSIRRGLAESYRSGVGCIGEIATTPVSLQDYYCARTTPSEIDVVTFHEQLGHDVAMFLDKRNELSRYLVNQSQRSSVSSVLTSHLYLGISPHAPYSVHPALLDQMIKQAEDNQVPVAMHLAETEAEREFLSDKKGLFIELLKDLGAWNFANSNPSQSISEIIQKLGRCVSALIVHGNYLHPDEIQLIARHGNRMTVVYCPRTHEYFQHPSYPLHQMQSAGISIAIGTDSRASSPDLDLFAELITVARKFPELSPQTILRMGTVNGAHGLGLSGHSGTLSQGKLARMSIIENSNATADAGDWMFQSSSRCSRVAI